MIYQPMTAESPTKISKGRLMSKNRYRILFSSQERLFNLKANMGNSATNSKANRTMPINSPYSTIPPCISQS